MANEQQRNGTIREIETECDNEISDVFWFAALNDKDTLKSLECSKYCAIVYWFFDDLIFFAVVNDANFFASFVVFFAAFR